MKIGVSAFAWTTRFTSSHLDILPWIGEQGIEAVEIPMFDPTALAAFALRRACEAAAIECTVCAILPAGINPISPDAMVRKKSLDHLIDCVKTSADLGAGILCGPLYAPTGYLPGRRRNVEDWKWAVECFRSLGEILDANEITLSIEPVNRSETFFLNTGAEAREFCDAVDHLGYSDHSRMGVTIDTFHANIEEKNIATAIRLLGASLKHVHASENDRGLLGSGHVNFPEIIQALRKIDYRGYLIIEGFGYAPNEKDSLGALWGDLNVSPEEIASRGAAYLRSLLQP